MQVDLKIEASVEISRDRAAPTKSVESHGARGIHTLFHFLQFQTDIVRRSVHRLARFSGLLLRWLGRIHIILSGVLSCGLMCRILGFVGGLCFRAFGLVLGGSVQDGIFLLGV